MVPLLPSTKKAKIPPTQKIKIDNCCWFQSGIISLWSDLNFDIMFAKKLPFKAFSFFIQFVLCIHCKCYIFSNDLFFCNEFCSYNVLSLSYFVWWTLYCDYILIIIQINQYLYYWYFRYIILWAWILNNSMYYSLIFSQQTLVTTYVYHTKHTWRNLF